MQSQKDEDVNKLKSGNWSSLDIFLFSNGQQYSPPRKYNLRTADLSWWDTTLNYLARAQYGSKHTNIQLYTIEGKRVEGPLELSNGTAYVAVEPPDQFVQSGYHKYLMKASRSWERRQERIVSESASEKANKAIKAEESLASSTNIKIIQDITIVPGNATIKEEQATAIVTKSVSKDKQSGPKNISVKQLQKQKPCVPQQTQRPSILRKKFVKPESPLPKKRTPLSSIDSTKNKINCGSRKTLEKVQSDLKSENLIILQIAETKPEDKDKPEPHSVSKIVHDQEQKQPQSITKANISEHKISQNVVKEVENVTKEILAVPFHYEEHYQSDHFNANKIPVIKEKQDLQIELSNTEHKEIMNSTTSIIARVNSNQSSTKIIMPSEEESKSNFLIVKPTKTHDSSVVTGSQTAERTSINCARINENQSSTKIIMPSKEESKSKVLIDKPTKTHDSSVVTGSQTAERTSINYALINTNQSSTKIIIPPKEENKLNVLIDKPAKTHEISVVTGSPTAERTSINCARINANQSSTKIIIPPKEESKSNVLIDKPTKTHEISVVTGSQTADSFVIVVSQGDTVNLKLNIEVINSFKSMKELRTLNQTKSVSDTNVIKVQQEEVSHGKVDMFVENSSLTENCRELSKSLQSTFTTEPQEIISDLKLNQMCGCSCCSNKAFPFRTASVYVDNNNYFILLPSEIGNKNFVSCNCKFETPTPSKCHIDPTARDTVELAADTFTVSVSQVELKLFDCNTQCSLNAIPKIPIASENDLATESCVCLNSRHKDSYVVVRQSAYYVDHIVNDASTQTDWNCLLLEVRIDEDGCCSFHMPTLEMLKLYNVL